MSFYNILWIDPFDDLSDEFAVFAPMDSDYEDEL